MPREVWGCEPRMARRCTSQCCIPLPSLPYTCGHLGTRLRMPWHHQTGTQVRVAGSVPRPREVAKARFSGLVVCSAPLPVGVSCHTHHPRPGSGTGACGGMLHVTCIVSAGRSSGCVLLRGCAATRREGGAGVSCWTQSCNAHPPRPCIRLYCGCIEHGCWELPQRLRCRP